MLTSVSRGRATKNCAADANYDRHIYLDKDGRIVFGVYPGAVKIVYTAAGRSYADSKWHNVIATLSSAGESLYVDGQWVMTDTTVTSAEQYQWLLEGRLRPAHHLAGRERHPAVHLAQLLHRPVRVRCGLLDHPDRCPGSAALPGGDRLRRRQVWARQPMTPNA